jgi:ubiquinone/menaquinone biosynthesis C-methylase UbiE
LSDSNDLMQKAFWNEKSVNYKRMNRNHLKKIKIISDFINPVNGMKILEVGIGSGEHAEYILNKAEIAFYGLDISDKMIEILREKYIKNKKVSFTVGTGEKLPYPDNFFDAVYCTATLHHLNSPEKGISEMYRVLKKGGRFIAIEPNVLFPKNYRQALKVPEEKNLFLITKRNLKLWLGRLDLSYKTIYYYIHTIPFPKFLFGVYDVIDYLFSKIPLIRMFAIQIIIKGIKE